MSKANVLNFLVNCVEKVPWFELTSVVSFSFLSILVIRVSDVLSLGFYDIIHNEVVDAFIVLDFVFVSSLAHHSTHQIRPSITFLFRPGCDAEAWVDL